MSIKKLLQAISTQFKQAVLGRWGNRHLDQKTDFAPRGLTLQIKRLYPEVILPSRAHPTDAGLDLIATSHNHHSDYDEYGTGLAVVLPPGTVGLLFPRSSISNKDLSLANAVGVIDEAYRGEIKARFRRLGAGPGPKVYQVGEKIMQLVIVPCLHPELAEVQSLEETDRGTGGFGSSGI